MYQKRMLSKRRENGLCLNCGKPLDRDGAYCVSCNDKRNADNVAMRLCYIKSGVCPICRSEPILGSEKSCPECRAKSSEKRAENRSQNKQKYNENHRNYSRSKYQERKENGICTRCGKRKAKAGYSTCEMCQFKNREYKRIKYGRKPDRTERIEYGICYFCENPIKDGYKVCEKHYEMNVKKLNNEKCRQATEQIKKKFKRSYINAK